MNFYNPLAGMTGYTKATDADVNTAMVDSARTNTALVRLEADRIKRMRDEEFLRTGREAIPDATMGTGTAPVEIANMPNAAVQVAPATTFDDYATGGAFTTAPTPAPAPNLAPRTALEREFAAKNQTPAEPDQRAAETARLAGKPNPLEVLPEHGTLKGKQWEQQRLKELQRKNPTGPSSSAKARPATGELQSPAETQRLIEKNRAAAQGQAQAPAQAQARAPAQAPAPTPAGTGSAAVWDTNKTADKYAATIKSAAAQYGVDPVVLRRLLGTESSFRPDAVSPDGASVGLGIAQIGAVHGVSDADRLDPNKAIPKAAEILARYTREAGGDVRAALLRYKGVKSAKGKAKMDPIVDSILSGTAQPQAPAQDEAPVDGATAPASTQVAVSTAAPVAPNTPAFMFSPSQVGNTQAQAGEQLRLSRAKLAQLNRMLAVAPDAETMMKYQTAALTLQANMQDALYRDATSRAARGDEAALASLAEAAGMAYAQTNQGFVQAAPDAEGNYRAVGKPVDRLTFVTNLYGTLSGQTAARAAELAKQMAGAQANVWEAQQKYATVDAPKAMYEQRYNLQLEQIKGVNTLMGKEADSLKEMQKIILQNNLDPNKSGKFFKDDQNNVFFSTRDGILMYEPGKPMEDGMVGPGRMKMVPLG